MRRVLLAVASAGFLLVPAAASAQLAPVPSPTEYLQFIGKGDAVVATWGGVYLGPYVGSFASTDQRFAIYCVDYVHHASSQYVNTTSLASGQTDADMGNTLLGTATGSYSTYQQAAYLSSLFESWDDFDEAGRDSDRRTIWSALHAAIWKLTSNENLGGGDTEWWRDEFLALAAQNAGGSSSDGWYVLSAKGDYNGQEFLIQTASVPEPTTLLLMATGLLMIAVVTWRRRTILPEA